LLLQSMVEESRELDDGSCTTTTTTTVAAVETTL